MSESNDLQPSLVHLAIQQIFNDAWDNSWGIIISLQHFKGKDCRLTGACRKNSKPASGYGWTSHTGMGAVAKLSVALLE